MKWRKARKKPVVVQFREVEGEKEIISTRAGAVIAVKGRDYVIRDVRGEEYPILKEIFNETYEVLREEDTRHE